MAKVLFGGEGSLKEAIRDGEAQEMQTYGVRTVIWRDYKAVKHRGRTDKVSGQSSSNVNTVVAYKFKTILMDVDWFPSFGTQEVKAIENGANPQKRYGEIQQG